MLICKALKKYTHSSFSLQILEYCEISEILKREQYYLNTLNLGYNILPTAGSPRGSIRSEESKKKISEALKGTKHPNYGKAISSETKKRISEARKGQVFGAAIGKPVEVFDKETNETKIYASGRLAAKDIGVYPTTIFRAIQSGKPIKKRWEIKFKE